MTMLVCEAKATCDTIEDLGYNFCPPDKEYNPDNARVLCVKSNCDKNSVKDVNSCCRIKLRITDGKCEGVSVRVSEALTTIIAAKTQQPAILSRTFPTKYNFGLTLHTSLS